LINNDLYPVASYSLNQATYSLPNTYKKITAFEHLDKVIDIDQSPIGPTPRSNSATYIGLFMEIHDLFAKITEARAPGYKPGRFSFNVSGGRCEGCFGDGLIRMEMHFFPDAYVMCDVCRGQIYNRETMEVELRAKILLKFIDYSYNWS
jgi:excinuclease ABC subunit A